MRLLVLQFGAFVLCLAALATPAAAVTLRYALIVGNNRGFDAAEPLPALTHAESEARRLRDQLVELSNFSPSPERTVLLLGATRHQLRKAVETLAKVRARDVSALGQADTVFAFFFTGHGLRGRLLLDDGAIGGEELGGMFRQMNADFTMAMVDACYSGSLDPELLKQKGIEPTPGLNLFRELPEEVLSAKGSVFFVSSGPDQPSYEDETLGGVFTHFFIEGLGKAERDGPGITLERIWDYAREHTVEYTAARKRRQTPQQWIASLQSKGPMYFSFPLERSASLVLAPALAGTFVLSYAGSGHTEVIEKRSGLARELAVFPGRARLMIVEGGALLAQDELALETRATVLVRSNLDPVPRAGLGQTKQQLWEKGFAGEQVEALRLSRAPTLLAGAGYALGGYQAGVLAPVHTPYVAARLDYGRLSAVLGLGLGIREEQFPSWRYRVHTGLGELQVGPAFELGPVRIGARALIGAGPTLQRFEDGKEREAWLLQPGASLGALVPIGPMYLELAARGGALYTLGAGAEASRLWRPWIGGGLGVWFQAL